MQTHRRGGRRIAILCEGDTEELAIRHFVLRQWKSEGLMSVGIDISNLKGHLESVKKKASLYLSQQQYKAVFTLVDLHEMNRVRHNTGDSLDTKVKRVKSWLTQGLPEDFIEFFHPHVSVHEIESLILAEGHALSVYLGNNSIKPDPHAEEKDDDNPPKRRCHILFKQSRHHGYNPKIDGALLFQRMRFDVVYENCPYFRCFYDDLKETARLLIEAKT